MEPIYGVHLGLVVSSTSDPEGRNRVQVWIPHLSSTLYSGINAKLKNLSFKSPGDLDKSVLETLRKTLPWAEYAAPLFGGSSGMFNESTGATATNAGSTLNAEANAAPLGYNPYPPDMNSTGEKTIVPNVPEGAAPTTIRTTHYSVGTSVGGPDSYSNPTGKYPDPYTNKGLTATGKNLGVGVVGSTIPGVKQGDIVQRINPITGVPEVYYVGDTATASVSQGRIDIYTSPTNWQSKGSAWDLANQEPDVQSWTVVDNVGKLGSYDAVLATLQNYSQYGQVPTAQSTQEGLASIGNDVPAATPSTTPSPSKTPILIANRTGGTAAVAGNAGTAGSAVGSYTTPNAGSKVWVFFLGGDIQRPVYFAQAPNPGDVAAA